MDKKFGNPIYATMFSQSSATSEKLLGIKKVNPEHEMGGKWYADETIIYTGFGGDTKANKGYFLSTRMDDILHGSCKPRRTKVINVDAVSYPLEDKDGKKTVVRFTTVKELFAFMVKERGYQYFSI